MEGGDRNREVLGQREWAARSRVVLRRDIGEWSTTGGSLNGLTKDSVLAVYPPVGEARPRRPLGHVRIVKLKAFESIVEPCQFAGLDRSDHLPIHGRCELAFIAQDRPMLRVAFRESGPERASAHLRDGDALATMRQRFAERTTESGSLVTVVDDASAADWLVWFGQEQLHLTPAAGWPADRDVEAQKGYGPVPEDDQAVGWLYDRLTRIARAKNLLYVATESQNLRYRGVESDDVKVDVELRRLRDSNDKQGELVYADGKPATFRDGDSIQLKVTNRGQSTVDLTVLCVTSEHGIIDFFPAPHEVFKNQLSPTGKPYVLRLKVEANTLGQEHLVVLAVRGKEPPVNFTWLAQPSLARASMTRGANDGATSHLARMLQDAMLGTQQTRGNDRTDAEDVAFSVLTWETLPR